MKCHLEYLMGLPRLDTQSPSPHRRHLHRQNLNAITPGISRSTTAKATVVLEEAPPFRKTAITPWPDLTSSQRSPVAVSRMTRKLPNCLHPYSEATALFRGREAMRMLTKAITCLVNKTITRSGSVVHKLMPLTGKHKLW